MKKLRLLFVALVATLMALATVSPASAITDGELDGDDHPYVGLMVAKIDGQPISRCSGALISSTVYVTAGHCVDGDTNGVTIWFETTLEPDASVYGYPFGGETSVDGTPYLYPGYLQEAFFYADLAVVVLDEPYELDSYASLPEAGVIDTVKRGRKGDLLTAVGYGLQEIVDNPQKGPIKLQADRTRYQADLMIVDTRGVAGIGRIDGSNSMIVSGDAANGGTCFGDSGGPFLLDGAIVAVNSFGLNSNCAGIGGVYRIDNADAIGWIESFLN